jgi:hypothetical protein
MKGAKGPVKFTEPYRLVGRQVSMTVSREDVLLRFDLRIVSVTDTELVLEPAPGKKVRYVREK